MLSPIVGLHHVTAIASDPQRNVNFYTGVMGLRFVKRSCTLFCRQPSAIPLLYALGRLVHPQDESAGLKSIKPRSINLFHTRVALSSGVSDEESMTRSGLRGRS